MENKIYLDLLRELLEDNIDHKYYCIDGNVEDASCICYYDGFWQVYDYIRGQKYDLFEFKEFMDAAKELILRITSTEDEEEKLIRELQNVILTHASRKSDDTRPCDIITIPAGSMIDDNRKLATDQNEEDDDE